MSEFSELFMAGLELSENLEFSEKWAGLNCQKIQNFLKIQKIQKILKIAKIMNFCTIPPLYYVLRVGRVGES